MTGTNVVAGVSSTDAEGLFGDISADNPGVNFIALEMKGILPKDKGFKVKQTNPALEYFSTDTTVKQVGSDWVKERTYSASDDVNLWIVLLDGNTKAVIEVTPDGEPAVTYTVNSNWATA